MGLELCINLLVGAVVEMLRVGIFARGKAFFHFSHVMIALSLCNLVVKNNRMSDFYIMASLKLELYTLYG